jgi:hypothetical protein
MPLPTKYAKLTPQGRRAVRLEYMKLQDNKCWYCQGSLDEQPPERILKFKIDLKWFPPGFLDSPVHLQHDHETGLTEGAVHGYCNAVLWEYYGR